MKSLRLRLAYFVALTHYIHALIYYQILQVGPCSMHYYDKYKHLLVEQRKYINMLLYSFIACIS